MVMVIEFLCESGELEFDTLRNSTTVTMIICICTICMCIFDPIVNKLQDVNQGHLGENKYR